MAARACSVAWPTCAMRPSWAAASELSNRAAQAPSPSRARATVASHRAAARALPASASGSPSMPGLGHPHAVELDVGQGPGRVEAGGALERELRGRHDEQAERARVPAGGHHHLVDVGGAQDVLLVAPQQPAVAVALGGGDHGERIPPAALVEGQRAGRAARGHAGQEAVGLGGGARLPHDRGEQGLGGEEGPGRRGPAHLLQQHRQLDEAAAEAAQVDVDGQRGPAQPAERGGQLLQAGAAAGDVAHHSGRALPGERRPRAVAQLQLLVGELEVHRLPLSTGRRRRARELSPTRGWGEHSERYVASRPHRMIRAIRAIRGGLTMWTTRSVDTTQPTVHIRGGGGLGSPTPWGLKGEDHGDVRGRADTSA